MSSEGSIADRKIVVADVATRLFGTVIPAERVIGETLVRATADAAPVSVDRIRRMPPTSFEDLVADRWPPGSSRLSVWTPNRSRGR